MENSFKIIDQNKNNKKLLDEISLSYEERFIRRKKLIANNGTEFLVNLLRKQLVLMKITFLN